GDGAVVNREVARRLESCRQARIDGNREGGRRTDANLIVTLTGGDRGRSTVRHIIGSQIIDEVAEGIIVLVVILERDGPGSRGAHQYQPEWKRVAFVISMIARIQCAGLIPERR